MLEVLRQRRWMAFTVFVLAVFVLCLVLARWQWGRYQERRAQNERLDAALAAPVVPVDDLMTASQAGPGLLPLPQEHNWRTVAATGTFDTPAEVAVRRRPLDGRTGFWIVTPLVTDSGVVLVNRGWAPAGRDATTAPDVPPAPSGTVTVTGRLLAGETTSTKEAPPPGQAWAVDPQALVEPPQALRFSGYMQLRSSDPPAGSGLTALPDPGHRGLNNLVYAVQWLIFAAVGAFGWWRLLTVEAKKDAPTG